MTKGVGRKRAILNVIGFTGLHRLLAPMTGGAGAILTLHRVRPARPADFAPNANLEVTPEFLAETLGWLARRKIDVVSLDEAMRRVGTPGSRRFVAITFDDGYRDNLEFAIPVLKAHNAPFTIFIPTAFIDRAANPWWMTLESVIGQTPDFVELRNGSEVRRMPTATAAQKAAAYGGFCAWLEAMDEDAQRTAVDDLAASAGFDVQGMLAAEFMDWDEVKQVAGEPLATIGAHTVNHFALAKLTPERAREEVLRGAAILEERLGAYPRHFAYPYGFDAMVSPRDHAILAELGFVSAVRTVPGVLSSASLERRTALHRISLNGHFQKQRYNDVLLSGVLFVARDAASRLKARIRGGRSAPIVPASASR